MERASGSRNTEIEPSPEDGDVEAAMAHVPVTTETQAEGDSSLPTAVGAVHNMPDHITRDQGASRSDASREPAYAKVERAWPLGNGAAVTRSYLPALERVAQEEKARRKRSSG